MARPTKVAAAFPAGPLLTDTGEMTPAWRGFFMALMQRTGGVAGADISAVSASLEQQSAALSARDDDLAASIAAETNARRLGDTGEATARQNADALLLPKTGGALTGALTGPQATFGVVGTGGPGGPTWTAGAAVPIAVQPAGSLYSRPGGGVGATLYVSQGAGVWNAVAGV